MGDAGQEEGWVICRIFKKKSHFKTLNSPIRNQEVLNCCNEGAFEQILEQMGRVPTKEDNNRLLYQHQQQFYSERFLKLPNLETPTQNGHPDPDLDPDQNPNPSGLANWVALDRLVASQLNGQTENSRQLACFSDPSLSYSSTSTDEQPHNDFHLPNQKQSFQLQPNNRPHQAVIQDYNTEIELWNFATRS